jgi:hypothetical protein
MFKKFVRFTAITIVTIMLCVACGSKNAEGKGKYVTDKAVWYIDQHDGSVVVYANDRCSSEIFGSLSNAAASLDKSKSILLMSEKGNQSLYNQDGARIAENVTEAVLSLDGETVAFWANGGQYHGDLCVYTGGETKVIFSGYTEDGFLAVSPDGSAIIYLTYDSADSDSPVSYCYYKGENFKLNNGEYTMMTKLWVIMTPAKALGMDGVRGEWSGLLPDSL